MKVPMADLRAQLRDLSGQVEEAALGVIRSGGYILGEGVARFESAVAEYIGAKHAIGVSSGTDALLIGLMALEVKPGDRVITTAYSFFATAGVIARLGAIPVFIDIDPTTYNIDPQALGQWLDENQNLLAEVKAIIPVHLYGQCAEMQAILDIAQRYDIPVIEDAAQAIGSVYPKAQAKAGTMGAMGAFSFFPSKNLGGAGDGGLVTTNDDGLAESLRKLRVHGAKPKYFHSVVGGNFRLDAIQAAVLQAKLPHLENWHERRRGHAAYYDGRFADIQAITTPACVVGRENHIYNQYVIACDDRDGLRAHLSEREISTAIFYPLPFHLQECFSYLGYQKGQLPHSERAAQSSLAIPVYPELSDAQRAHVADSVIQYVA